MINALSFQRIDTHNHSMRPISVNTISYKTNSEIPLIDMASNTKMDAIHFTYQSNENL